MSVQTTYISGLNDMSNRWIKSFAFIFLQLKSNSCWFTFGKITPRSQIEDWKNFSSPNSFRLSKSTRLFFCTMILDICGRDPEGRDRQESHQKHPFVVHELRLITNSWNWVWNRQMFFSNFVKWPRNFWDIWGYSRQIEASNLLLRPSYRVNVAAVAAQNVSIRHFKSF